MSDYKEIWETLSQVDVSEYVEEKMNLSYLSWSRAWYLLCQKYADAKYLYHEPKKFEDGTMEVAVTITICECSRSATLPVMDYKNNSIINPDSRQINDNKQRCFTKAIAMFGLGISLYMGFSDDLPDESKDKKSEEVKKKTAKKVVKMKEEQPPKEEEDDEYCSFVRSLARTHARTHARTNERTNGRTNEQTKERTYERTNERPNEQTNFLS